MGCCSFVFKSALFGLIGALAITFIPYLPPHAKVSQPYRVTPAQPFTGPLALNEKLKDAEKWHEGDLMGPEAFADYNGELYSSLHGGDIVKLVGNHITPVVKTGKPCKHAHEEEICGRPLGMQFDKNGYLYVADPYYGVFKINVKTGHKELLISVNEVINGVQAKLPNSIALARNGDIYWTDSSTQFKLYDGIYDILADPSGRLIHYDARTKKNTVLLDGLRFANGLVLSENEDYIIVSETGMNRLLKVHLTGSWKGRSEVFIDGLPGMPDNLKPDGKGGIIVPLVIAADAENPQFVQVVGEFPLLRRFFVRLLGIIEFGFQTLDNVYPCDFAKKSVYYIGHFSIGSKIFAAKRVSILRVNKNGEITDSIHTLSRNIAGIAEAHPFKDHLYLGSPFNNYIGRISLDKVGWSDLKSKPTTVPPTTTTTPKPTTTTPKPTTTTPKPTTTTPKPTTTTTTPRPTTTTPKPTTTQKATPKPAATTQKPTAAPAQKPQPAKQTQPPPTTQKAAVKDSTKSVPV